MFYGTSLAEEPGLGRGGSWIYLSLHFSAIGVLEILTFSAKTSKKSVLFAAQIRLKLLYVNAFMINQQTPISSNTYTTNSTFV